MIRNICFVITVILGIITIYCYATNKSKSASIIITILTTLSLIIAIYPTILEQEKIEPYIILDYDSFELLSGDEYALNVTISPNDAIIEWNSSDSKVVTVDDKGHLKALNEGTATITATIVYNNVRYSSDCSITVGTQSNEYNDNSNNNNQNKDDTKFDANEIDSEIVSNSDIQESETNSVSIRDVAWLDDEQIYKDDYATTMRGEPWSDCIRFGSSNLNSDGESILIVVCDQKYNKFTAEIAPQKGFDKTETVTLYIYGANEEGQTFKEEFQINYSTKPFRVEYDISSSDELYFCKKGNYNLSRIGGQLFNGYTGMGVLMRDATLYK